MSSLDYFLNINHVKTPSPLKYDGSSPFGRVGVQNPITVIDGKNARVHEVVLGIITFHKSPPATIYDPTCGRENYQFKPWLENGVLEKLGYKYVSGDLKAYGELVNDVFHVPLRGKSVDVIVYDPPFTTHCRIDDRGSDYDIDKERSPEEIKKYYSKNVFEEFHRVLRDGGIVIVKGADFYYPPKSTNLFFFVKMVDFEGYFTPVALYIYRYWHSCIPLLRYRLRNWKRPLICHSYYLVLEKR